MEVKSKSTVEATHAIVAESGNLEVAANVTVNSDNVVTKIASGTVKKDDTLVARFGLWNDKHLQVTYLTSDKAECDAIFDAIEEFKSSATA